MATHAGLPADLQTTALTDAEFSALDAKYKEFNEDCRSQLQEMNNNIVSNIEARSGNLGWTMADDLSCMEKTFHFNSFEQGNAFVQGVVNFCNQKDHHPEWSVQDGGKQVHIRLTTHWAGNTVTRSDFELAEALNKAEIVSKSEFRQYPRFSAYQTATWQIAFAAFVLGPVAFKVATGTNHTTVK